MHQIISLKFLEQICFGLATIKALCWTSGGRFLVLTNQIAGGRADNVCVWVLRAVQHGTSLMTTRRKTVPPNYGWLVEMKSLVMSVILQKYVALCVMCVHYRTFKIISQLTTFNIYNLIRWFKNIWLSWRLQKHLPAITASYSSSRCFLKVPFPPVGRCLSG